MKPGQELPRLPGAIVRGSRPTEVGCAEAANTCCRKPSSYPQRLRCELPLPDRKQHAGDRRGKELLDRLLDHRVGKAR